MTAVAAVGTDHRALPGKYLDLIRDGVKPAELKAHGRRAVLSAIRGSATSAIQRGWAEHEWVALVMGDSAPSALGVQHRTHRTKKIKATVDGSTVSRTVTDPRPATRREIERDLGNIWRAQVAWITANPPLYNEPQIRAHIAAVREAFKGSGLGANDRTVMRVVLAIAEDHCTVTPACPRRTIMAASGLGNSAVPNGLRRLTEAGWLKLDHPGRSGKPSDGKPGKAALYRLTVPARAALPLRSAPPAGGSIDPPPQSGGSIDPSRLNGRHEDGQEQAGGSIDPSRNGSGGSIGGPSTPVPGGSIDPSRNGSGGSTSPGFGVIPVGGERRAALATSPQPAQPGTHDEQPISRVQAVVLAHQRSERAEGGSERLRPCADCGIRLPSGHVRCQSCFRAATLVPASRYGEPA